MISDEEKKAIEKLSGKKNERTWDDTIRQIKREEIKDVVVTRQKYIATILNLIEKQQKEIEELKKPKYLLNAKTVEITTINNSEFISKDKIKAKIEELIKEGNYRTADNPNGRVHFMKEETDYKIEILQELLEEE